MNISKSFGLKKCGIYCITNIVNNKIYIGSSKNIYHRLKRHHSELKRGIHTNKYLQNSYLKYGPSNFNVSIIEETLYENLQEKEQNYINTLKPDYNITIEVIRNTPSLESRMKISATLKEQKKLGTLKYPTHDDKKKPVIIYDTDCNCIGNYESERAASKKLEELYPGINHSQSVVNKTVNLRSIRAKVKRYKKHYLLRPDEKCNNEKRFRSDGIKIKVIDQFSNIQYMFPTLIEAGKVLGCSETSIRRALVKSKLLLKKYKVVKYEN
jgi:group I intron endonuclease